MAIIPPSSFATKLVTTAEDQYNKYRTHVETDPLLSAQIQQYYKVLGFKFQSVSKVPWSAIFISWCVKQAGATNAEFHFAESHSVFVHQAIQNKLNNTGVFQGQRVSDYAPKLGDIIQNNRNGNHFDYDYARQNTGYDSHSAIVVQIIHDATGHYALTIGGNESDSVRQRRVVLDNNGLIIQPAGYASYYISVIEDLKH